MSIFNTKRILPFGESMIKVYPHHALATGILESNEHNLPLLLTEYIQLVFDHTVDRMDFSVSLYIQSYIRNIPLTFFSLIPREFVYENYKDYSVFLRNCIENGYYVYCIVDTYHIAAYKKCYMNLHMLHDLTIYGYDRKKGVFYTADCFVDGKHTRAEISEKELRNALAFSIADDWLDGFVLLKTNENPYRGIGYDTISIKKEIGHYLNGEPSGYISIAEYRRRIPQFYAYGIEVYDSFVEYLENVRSEQKGIDLRLAAVLLEHKKVMLYIAEQLYASSLLMDIDKIRNSFLELTEKIRNCELLMAKYNVNSTADGISEMIQLLRDIQIMDMKAMSLLQDSIQKQFLTIETEEEETSEVRFCGEDKKTGGNWTTSYGSAGYHVIGVKKQLPEYMKKDGYLTSNAVYVVLKNNVTERVAPVYGGENERRIAAYYLNGEELSVKISLKDDEEHRISLYFMDYDHLEREQVVEILHAGTGEVLDKRQIGDFYQGIYLSYYVKGEIIIRIRKINGPDAVISAVFFD